MSRSLPDHWFFCEDVDEDGMASFSAEEARHATKALRLRRGDRIQWLDGVGVAYGGDIVRGGRSELLVRVLSQKRYPLPPRRSLSVGILHDATRLEWLCEKATELGATKLRLLRTGRTERPRYKLARLRAKTIAALKQSGRFHLPIIEELDFEDAVATTRASISEGGAPGLIAHCHVDLARSPLASLPSRMLEGDLLIGPEGDFTLAEVERALDCGMTAVQLGAARLRTETAAIAALSYMALRLR